MLCGGASIPAWLSDFITSVMAFPQAEREAGPGERGGGDNYSMR
jgi:hypothetical protein